MANIGGEFRAPGKYDHTLRELRVRFLQKIEALAPEVLDDLHAKVLPAFREAVDSTDPAESTSEGSPADDQQLARRLRRDASTEKAFDVHRLASKSPRVEQARLALREAEECIGPRIQPLRRALIEAQKTKDRKEIAQMEKRIHRIWKAEITPLEKDRDRVWEEETRRAAKEINPDDEYHLPDAELAGFARHRDRSSFPDWFSWEFEPTGDGSAPSPWDALSPNIHITVVRFHEALLDWAEKYYIAKPWLLDVALWTLQCWIAGRELKKFAPPAILQIPPEPPRQIRFTHPGWHPTLTRRHVYKQETLEAFTRQLQEYLDASTKAAKLLIRLPGFQPGLKKRELDRHLEWLVLWQVGDWNRSQIGEKCNASPDTVKDGIESAAKEIGLKLRKGKTGRPPKDSDPS